MEISIRECGLREDANARKESSAVSEEGFAGELSKLFAKYEDTLVAFVITNNTVRAVRYGVCSNPFYGVHRFREVWRDELSEDGLKKIGELFRNSKAQKYLLYAEGNDGLFHAI